MSQTRSAVQLRIHSLRFRHSADLIVDEVLLAVEPGKIIALFGPNGSGKSTLIRYLANRNANDLVAADALPQLWTTLRLGIVPQRTTAAVYHWLSAIDNVAQPFVWEGQSRDAARRIAWTRAAPLLQRVPIGRLVSTLSGGQQSSVVIAREASRDAEVLLVDEGMAALDYENRFFVSGWLRERCQVQGMSALLVAHDAELAAFVADEVLVLTPRPARIHASVRPKGPIVRTTGELGSPWLAAAIQVIQERFSEAINP